MLGMVTTMMDTGFEWSFPEVDVVWGGEVSAELPEADTDLHPGAPNTGSLLQVCIKHALFHKT